MRQIAWGIEPAAVFDGVHDEVDIVFFVDIKWRNGPSGLGFSGLLLHVEHFIVFIEHHYTRSLQFGFVGLVMTHDARCAFGFGKIHEALKREEKQVVSRHHEHIVLDASLLNGELQVAHGPESGLVGGGAIIDHGDGFGIMLLARPVFEDLSETVVGHDDMFIDLRDGINVIQHTSKDGRLTDLEQWLGEVLCQLSKPCGIASSNYDCFHTM